MPTKPAFSKSTSAFLAWVMTVSIAVMVFCVILGSSPTRFHRLFVAASMALMVCLNGFVWWCTCVGLGPEEPPQVKPEESPQSTTSQVKI
jgi:hypothetical protein